MAESEQYIDLPAGQTFRLKSSTGQTCLMKVSMSDQSGGFICVNLESGSVFSIEDTDEVIRGGRLEWQKQQDG